MRRTLRICCCLSLCLLLAACSTGELTPRGGVYAMSVPPETLAAPTLTLDAEAATFLFSYDPLSSRLPAGSYSQEGNVMTCVTDDGLHVYLFRVVNSTTLAFIAQGSADVTLTDGRLGAPVVEGSVFLLGGD